MAAPKRCRKVPLARSRLIGVVKLVGIGVGKEVVVVVSLEKGGNMELGLCVTAYLYDALCSVMEADGEPHPRAMELLNRTISIGLLQASGFLDSTGRSTSERYQEALTEARGRLHVELPEGHPAGLCRRLWHMAAVDGHITPTEIATVRAYAGVLNLEQDLVDEIGRDVLAELAKSGFQTAVPADW